MKIITKHRKFLQYQQKYYSTIFHNKIVAHKSVGILDFLQLSIHCTLLKWLYLETKVCNSLELEVIIRS